MQGLPHEVSEASHTVPFYHVKTT